jgi:hypothetical protein
MRVPILAALSIAALAGPAAAETRGYTITSFDKIRVAGPFTVNVRTNAGPSARAEGSAAAIDRLRVEVQGGTLVVSSDRNAWSGWQGENAGPVTLNVTTPGLASAILTGSGSLNIDRAKAPRFDLSLTGSGDVSVGVLTTELLRVTITGSGKATVAGKVAQTRALVQGAGAIQAAKLVTTDLDVTVNGSGDVSFAATRVAKVNASGSGKVDITGPAACSVRATGSGEVRCGEGG